MLSMSFNIKEEQNMTAVALSNTFNASQASTYFYCYSYASEINSMKKTMLIDNSLHYDSQINQIRDQ